VDDLVSAEATLMTAEKEHEQCVRDYERGEKELAQSNLASLTTRIQQANAVLEDERLEKKLEQLEMEVGDMERADLNEANRQMYLKGSKNRLYNAMKGKRGQYMLQEKDSGYEVKQLQTRLEDLQLYTGPVDGNYSEAVRKAVEAYQGRNGLETDGVAGPATLRSLNLY
jgi:murein L,D-transpeptidase YcbB/YkuD